MLLVVHERRLAPPVRGVVRRERGRVLAQVLLHLGRRLLEVVDRLLQVADEGVAATAAKVFADDDPDDLDPVRVRRQRVGGDDPAALTEVRDDRKLVVRLFFGELPRHERQRHALSGADDGEELAVAHGADGIGEVVRRLGRVRHDGTVASFSETQELVAAVNPGDQSLAILDREKG
jgi:hypothetical protein